MEKWNVLTIFAPRLNSKNMALPANLYLNFPLPEDRMAALFASQQVSLFNPAETYETMRAEHERKTIFSEIEKRIDSLRIALSENSSNAKIRRELQKAESDLNARRKAFEGSKTVQDIRQQNIKAKSAIREESDSLILKQKIAALAETEREFLSIKRLLEDMAPLKEYSSKIYMKVVYLRRFYEVIRNAPEIDKARLLTDMARIYLSLLGDSQVLKTYSYGRIDIKTESLLDQVEKILSDSDFDLIQFQFMNFDVMPPFSKLNPTPRKLDDWQLEMLTLIDAGESALVVAPTSSGKTVGSTYAATRYNQVLYMVPNDELARQVAATLTLLYKKNVNLLTNRERYGFKSFDINSSFFVLVGTPYEVENYLMAHPGLVFDYAIYDEIQKLNSESVEFDPLREGGCYERIIKMVSGSKKSGGNQTPFLMLSATVSSPTYLKKWSEEMSSHNVSLISYDKRFINQQRWVWNGQLKELNPLAAVDFTFVAEGGLLESGSMSMSPNDVFKLWLSMKDVTKVNIYSIYRKKQLTLNDVAQLENKLKVELTNLAKSGNKEYAKIVENVLFKFNTPLPISQDKERFDTPELYQMLMYLKTEKMLPAILFKMDNTSEAVILYERLITYLEDQERELYPWFEDDRKIISKYQDLIRERLIRLNDKKITKIPENMKPEVWKAEQTENIVNQETSRYKKEMKTRLDALLEKNHGDKNVISYVKYVMTNLVSGIEDVQSLNRFQPHQSFSFHQYPMGETTSREIKRDLFDFLKMEGISTGYARTEENGQKVSVDYSLHSKLLQKAEFDSIFMRGIMRGIVIYLKGMPVSFQRTAQRLVSEGRAPVVFSDESLAVGVNFPIKTSILLGSPRIEEIDSLKASQASGRSGRRGLDNTGNIVYMGVDWKNIIRAPYPLIVGGYSMSGKMFLPEIYARHPTEVKEIINEKGRKEQARSYRLINDDLLDKSLLKDDYRQLVRNRCLSTTIVSLSQWLSNNTDEVEIEIPDKTYIDYSMNRPEILPEFAKMEWRVRWIDMFSFEAFSNILSEVQEKSTMNEQKATAFVKLLELAVPYISEEPEFVNKMAEVIKINSINKMDPDFHDIISYMTIVSYLISQTYNPTIYDNDRIRPIINLFYQMRDFISDSQF